MQCTHCKYPDSRVVYTHRDDKDHIIRRRECMKCGMRYTTKEDLRSRDNSFVPINDRKYP
jgi:transcriptional regulator NrdR family protein